MKTKFRSEMWLGAVAVSLCGATAVAEIDRHHNGNPQRSTAEDFLGIGVGPIATGHHGVGPNQGEIQQRLPYVPELHQVLDAARHFNRKAGEDLGGILIVELKTFSPHCDPNDEFEEALVSAAVNEVRHAGMVDQVIPDP